MVITISKEFIFGFLLIALVLSAWYFMEYPKADEEKETTQAFIPEINPEEEEDQPVEIYNQKDMLYPDVHEHMKDDPRLTIDRMAYQGESPQAVGLTSSTCNTGTCSVNKNTGYQEEQDRLSRRFGVAFTAPFETEGNDEPVGLANDMISSHEDTMQNGILKEQYIMDDNMLPPEYRRGRGPGVAI